MKIVFDHLFEEKKDVVITLFLPAEPLEEKKWKCIGTSHIVSYMCVKNHNFASLKIFLF